MSKASGALVGFFVVLGLLAGCAPPDERPSIILVVLDTMRRDFTGLGADGESRTPRLDAFAESAIVWENAYSTAPWTVPSHASMFTGLLPSQHGVTSANPRFLSPEPTLAEHLNDSGYRTEAFYSNPWLLDEVTGLLRGFDEHFLAADPGEDLGDGPDQGGRETLTTIERRLADKEPFFFYVNFLESHAPYDPPKSIRAAHDAPDGRIDSEQVLDIQAGLHDPDEAEWMRLRDLYGGDVRAADRFFGELIDLLEERGFFENGVLIVTSDHGESLGEDGYVEHQLHLDETLLAVPLAIRTPERDPQRREDPVIVSDLYATVLEAAELPIETPKTSRSLLSGRISADRVLIGEYAGAPAPLLHHLRQRNPAFDVVRGAQAYRWIRTADEAVVVEVDGPEASAADGPEISEETRRRLRDLGYLQ